MLLKYDHILLTSIDLSIDFNGKMTRWAYNQFVQERYT